MKSGRLAGWVAALGVGVIALTGAADQLRNVKNGEAVPGFKLPTMDGEPVDSEAFDGRVLVLVYLSAEQRSSELAASDASEVVGTFDPDLVSLVFVTADVVHKPYFEKLRAEQGITAPLAFDADRSFYAELGLIVFPTTIVVDNNGDLAHVISTRGPDYPHVLDSYIRHALGEIDDAELADRLKAGTVNAGSPKSQASRHRAAARLLREKGLMKAAREELLKALELDPDDFDIRLDLADMDLATGDADQARDLAATLLEAQPEHRRAKQVMGIALYKLGDMEQAEAYLLGALELNPEPARARYYLGMIYEAQGRTDEALTQYREALRSLLNEPEE